MSFTWNNGVCVALESTDLQANIMSVDTTGNLVLLIGRHFTTICNLENEVSLNIMQQKKSPRHSKYEVTAAEWNPTNHNRHLCAISSNQRLEVLTFSPPELIQCCGVRGHSRAINDLNWHPIDPSTIATTALDTFVHLWDVRDLRRPTLSFVSIAEMNQVRWNRVNSSILATSHDGDVKVWDRRKGSVPLHYITAHLGSRINSMDWNPTKENHLVTCSHDNTVKLFDVDVDCKRSHFILNTNCGVWKVKYTPYGRGLVTVSIPFGGRRNENGLVLWPLDNSKKPIHTFIGHREAVLDFGWRGGQGLMNGHQLVSWSKDNSLFLWKLDDLLEKLANKSDISVEISENYINSSLYICDGNQGEAQTLDNEFVSIARKLVTNNNLKVIKLDCSNRVCLLEANINDCLIGLEIYFPDAYPRKVPPVFTITKTENLDESIQLKLIQILNNFALQHVSNNRMCLEACFKEIIPALERLTVVKNDSESKCDILIPHPRTSRAKFCSFGILVCFDRPKKHHIPKDADDSKTSKMKKRKSAEFVNMYDVSHFLPVNKALAEEYILDGDVSTICKHNAAAAAVLGRWDLVQVWSLAEYVATAVGQDGSWTLHPLGAKLAEDLIRFYVIRSDIQMAAMLSCVFDKVGQNRIMNHNRLVEWSGSETTASILSNDIGDDWVVPRMKRKSHVSSSSDTEIRKPNADDGLRKQRLFHEYYKRSYAEILHSWDLVYQRTEVLKCLSTLQDQDEGGGFLIKSCRVSQNVALSCIICHLSVRGAASCCVICGHGGHTAHINSWFQIKDQCPTGCGCKCLLEYAHFFSG